MSIVRETNHKNTYDKQNILSSTPFNPMFLTTQHFINGSHTQWPKMKAPQFFSWFIWSQTYCYLQLESHLITSIWKKAFWRFERRRVACTMAAISKYFPEIMRYFCLLNYRSVSFEMSVWYFEFFQNTNENNWIWGIIVVKWNFFVHFLEEFKTSKRHSEINWPLAKIQS